jgi:hypothetical protein
LPSVLAISLSSVLIAAIRVNAASFDFSMSSSSRQSSARVGFLALAAAARMG